MSTTTTTTTTIAGASVLVAAIGGIFYLARGAPLDDLVASCRQTNAVWLSERPKATPRVFVSKISEPYPPGWNHCLAFIGSWPPDDAKSCGEVSFSQAPILCLADFSTTGPFVRTLLWQDPK